MRKLPQGYRGLNHETIGSDILSVLKVVTFPESVLGKEMNDKLQGVSAEGWYPIEDLLLMMDRIEATVGRASLVQMGRNLFRASHAERAKQVAKNGADILFSINDMYHRANRGQDIGGWKVVEFKPGLARLEKNTPHHCVMEEGILLEAMHTVGVPVLVSQAECFRKGAGLCVYRVTSVVKDDRWMGGRPPIG